MEESDGTRAEDVLWTSYVCGTLLQGPASGDKKSIADNAVHPMLSSLAKT